MVLQGMTGLELVLCRNLVARCGSICGNPFHFSQQRKYFGEVLLKNFCGSLVVLQMLRSYKRRAFIYGMEMHQETILTGST
nr:Bifunctional dihydrofolate reductase-thymidylate synthase [Ipomoea batatas]